MGALAAGLLAPIATRYAATVASPVAACWLEREMAATLHRATRHLLLPWGARAAHTVRSVIPSLKQALHQITGEQVHQSPISAPVGVSAFPVFAPLEGPAIAQSQLAPLARQFPCWQQYVRLSCGAVQVILVGGADDDPDAGVRRDQDLLALSLLQVALGAQERAGRRDGDIYLSYVRSLVSALLRDGFHRTTPAREQRSA